MSILQALLMVSSHIKEGKFHKQWTECLKVCKKALIKQIPKKPEVKYVHRYGSIYMCGACKEVICARDTYCSRCGRKIRSDYGKVSR